MDEPIPIDVSGRAQEIPNPQGYVDPVIPARVPECKRVRGCNGISWVEVHVSGARDYREHGPVLR